MISSSQDKNNYDVFLNFCGLDTQEKFTFNLYKNLCKIQIRTFLDQYEIQRGTDIGSDISEAIKGSKISVVIFSENYVFSKWCLGELVEIIDSRKTHNQKVIPVFYNVSPSDLEKQIEGDAFAKEAKENIQSYRAAVTVASKISGFCSTKTRSDANLVEAVVSDIWQKLYEMSLSTDHKPQIDDITSKLSDNGQVVGICGEPGIGKTTLAKAVYQDISGQYDGCCFVSNVNKKIQRGIVRLKQKILSQILKGKKLHSDVSKVSEEKLRFDTADEPYRSCKDRLNDKKVLVVLDGVDTSESMRILIPIIHLCGSESRVIVITRNKVVLEDNGVADKYIYEVKGLTDGKDLRLFLTSAFKQDPPLERFMSLSQQIIPCARGHPLCLKTLGSSLRGKKRKVWESALNALKDQDSSTLEIHKVLKTCYDILDEKEQIVFIDFPYEFEGHKKEDLIRRLESLYGSSGLIALMDKCIVTESSKTRKLHMHRLLAEAAVKIQAKKKI